MVNLELEMVTAGFICLFKPVCACVCVCAGAHESLIAQARLTFFDPMGCNLPVPSVHGIVQSRILEWLPFPSPGELPDPRIELRSPMSLALQADPLPSEPSGTPLLRGF